MVLTVVVYVLLREQRFPRPIEDLFAFFAGTPGTANCYGQSVAALNQTYGNQPAAAAALGYPSVAALHAAIKTFCGS